MIQKRLVYLDNASTTPMDKAVLEAMKPYLTTNYGNASSLHLLGRLSKGAINKSRQIIANILGSKIDEIYFTSGGTESNNLAILGIAYANKKRGKHIIVSEIEHKSILKSCHKLESEGFEITYLSVDKNGLVSLEELKRSIKSDTILISIMYANNEIGTIQPIKLISKIIRQSKNSRPIFHTDACQAVNYLPIDVKKLGVDVLTISSSKIYGPKGIGCLYLSEKYSCQPIIYGGGQEKNLRSGTENVVGIVGLAKAMLSVEERKIKESKRLKDLVKYFLFKINQKIEGVSVNGSLKYRLPNNLNLAIKDVEGESLMLLLDEWGISCSTGSACSASDLHPSYVLTKIGLAKDLIHCSIRLSLGQYTTKADIEYTIRAMIDCISRIRKMTVRR